MPPSGCSNSRSEASSSATRSTRILRRAMAVVSTRPSRALIMSLATHYLGLQLAHPIVASASPLTATLDGMRQLEDAGAAAVVMASLYEEQIRAEDTAYALYTEHGSNSQAEADSYFPELPDYDSGVSGHLETLR